MRRRIRQVVSKSSNTKPKLSLAVPARMAVENRSKIGEVQLQTEIIRMASEGMSSDNIGLHLNIPTITVVRYLTQGLAEFYNERDDAAKKFLAITNARYNALYREWFPRAVAHTEIIKESDGNEVEIDKPGDPIAARVVLRALADQAKANGANKLRIEHTGKDGGKIDINIDWNNVSDEQLAKFEATGDVGVLRGFLAGANSGASANRNSTPTGSED